MAEEDEEAAIKNPPPDEIMEDEDEDDAEDDYEDDFEDYEDDFEDDDEGEDDDDDNNKMDSGHYDSRTAFERARDERELLEVKRAMARENSATR